MVWYSSQRVILCIVYFSKSIWNIIFHKICPQDTGSTQTLRVSGNFSENRIQLLLSINTLSNTAPPSSRRSISPSSCRRACLNETDFKLVDAGWKLDSEEFVDGFIFHVPTISLFWIVLAVASGFLLFLLLSTYPNYYLLSPFMGFKTTESFKMQIFKRSSQQIR